jgi:hypothetical protein
VQPCHAVRDDLLAVFFVTARTGDANGRSSEYYTAYLYSKDDNYESYKEDDMRKLIVVALLAAGCAAPSQRTPVATGDAHIKNGDVR